MDWGAFGGGFARGLSENIREQEKRRTDVLDQALNFGLQNWQQEVQKAKQDTKAIEEGMAALAITGLDAPTRFQIAQGGKTAVSQAFNLYEKSLGSDSDLDFASIYKVKNADAFSGMSDREIIDSFRSAPEYDSSYAKKYIEGRDVGGGGILRFMTPDLDKDVDKAVSKITERQREKGLMAKPSRDLPSIGSLEMDAAGARALYKEKSKERQFKNFKEGAAYHAQQISKLDPKEDAADIEYHNNQIEIYSNLDKKFGKDPEKVTIPSLQDQLADISQRRVKALDIANDDEREKEIQRLDQEENIVRSMTEKQTKDPTYGTFESAYSHMVQKQLNFRMNGQTEEADELQGKIDFLRNEMEEERKAKAKEKGESSPYAKRSVDSIFKNAYQDPAIGGLSKFYKKDLEGRVYLDLQGTDVIDNYGAITRSLDYVRDSQTNADGYIPPEMEQELKAREGAFTKLIRAHVDTKARQLEESGREVQMFTSKDELNQKIKSGEYKPKVGEIIKFKVGNSVIYSVYTGVKGKLWK